MASVQQHITRFWSTVAPDYESHPGNVVEVGTPAYERWIDAVRRVLPCEPCDVLDCATGTGFLALIMAGLDHRVTGIDLSAEMLAFAGAAADERGIDVRFMTGDAVAPDFPPESFDVVTS